MLPLTSFRPFASTIQHTLLCATSCNFSLEKQYERNNLNMVPNSTSSQQISSNISIEKVRRSSLSSYSLTSNDGNSEPLLSSRQKISSALKSRFSPLTSGNTPTSISTKTDLSKELSLNSDIQNNYFALNAKKMEILGAKSGEIYDAVTRGVKDILLGTDNEQQRLKYQQQKASSNEAFFITIGDDYR